MDEVMAKLSPVEILLVVLLFILAVCTAISTVGGAVEKVVKIFRAAKAPNEEQDVRISRLERDMEDVKKALDRDDKHLKAIDEGNRVSQVALLALLDHGIDGNNTKQMQAAKSDLQTYLINR